MTDPHEGLVHVPLTSNERYVLRSGLIEWGGPARCTDEFARVIGFADVAELLREGYTIAARIDASEPLTKRDWQRVLLAAEIVFVSDLYGSGRDWEITTGLSDTETITLLRQIQRKLNRSFFANPQS
jgi:hypothetical protein